jgi:regulator of protease activity HflC (stomatin/prohibitin superfamily)
VANQNIAKARQELETTKVEAEKQVAEANAQAESQRVRQQTLTPEILQQQAIAKWNGVLPVYSGDSGNLFFNIPAKQ